MRTYFVILLLLYNLVSLSQTIDSSLVPVLRKEKSFLYGKGEAMHLSLELQTIYVVREIFWLGMLIRNRSGLSYPIDLVRIYLHDKTQNKRSSAQELEIIPLYADSLAILPPRSNTRFLIAIPKFTIPDRKRCMIEIFETNGGRNLTLEITNWQLFKAKPLPFASLSSSQGSSTTH